MKRRGEDSDAYPPSSYAATEKIKSLILHTHGCLSAGFWEAGLLLTTQPTDPSFAQVYGLGLLLYACTLGGSHGDKCPKLTNQFTLMKRFQMHAIIESPIEEPFVIGVSVSADFC